jgi:two-component system response regulator
MPGHHAPILLVEDQPAEAELTLRALRPIQLADKVHRVKDGVEALDYLACLCFAGDVRHANPPKLVLLDLKLPKIDGIEVLRRIRGEEPTRLLPVVILSSSAEERDVAESYRCGANSYIVKPLDFNTFERVVSEVCLYWTRLNTTVY